MPLESYRAASNQRTSSAWSLKECHSAVSSALRKARSARVQCHECRKIRGREQLALLRERPLDQTEWLAVMMNGVFIGKEHCVVIALGIDSGGRKQVLDFEPGNSESHETVSRLIDRLKKRGVRSPECSSLPVVRDGSKAIESAVRRCWPEALRCRHLIGVTGIGRESNVLLTRHIERGKAAVHPDRDRLAGCCHR